MSVNHGATWDEGMDMMTTMMRKMMAMGLAVACILGSASATWAGIAGRIRAYGTTSWTASVNAGQTFRVVVDGDGDTDLDVYVYQNGVLLGQDTDSSDYCVVVARAPWRGQIRVVIRNLGRVYNDYVVNVY